MTRTGRRFPLAEFFSRILRWHEDVPDLHVPDPVAGRQGSVVHGIWHPPIG